MKDRLQAILDKVAPGADLSAVVPEENLRQALDIDSYDFLRLVQGIEADLGVTIPEADYPKLERLADLLDYLGARVSS